MNWHESAELTIKFFFFRLSNLVVFEENDGSAEGTLDVRLPNVVDPAVLDLLQARKSNIIQGYTFLENKEAE